MTAKTEPTITGLVEGIIRDTEKLIGQQFELFRQEVRQEIDQAKGAAVSFGAGAGLVALGGVLSTHAAAQLLHRSTRLPLWACYGVVSGALGAAGVGLLNRARREFADLRLAPPQTTAALKENLAWVKEQATGGAG